MERCRLQMRTQPIMSNQLTALPQTFKTALDRLGKIARLFLLAALAVCALPSRARDSDWIMPREAADPPEWGLTGGMMFGIYPGSLSGHGTGGPRGLLRIWCPTRRNGSYSLITFIAIEPVAQGRAKGFSELERSSLDNKIGKQISAPESASVRVLPSGEEELKIKLQIERFSNGAHVYLFVTQRNDHPDEIRFSIHREADSAPLKECTLTATWGNFTRSRQLWLKDEVIDSREVYKDYHGNQFAPDLKIPLSRLSRLPNGDAIAGITTNERNPAAVYPVSDSKHFHYGGAPVTQYWKKPHKRIDDSLCVRVNGRFVYWSTRQQVPGGIAFENFEMREPFYEGQAFVFGVTTMRPDQLGLVPPRDDHGKSK